MGRSRPDEAALWLLIGEDLMPSLISRNIPKSLWGQTTLMFIVLVIVLAVLRAFRALLHGGGSRMLRVRDRMVRGMAGEAKTGESIRTNARGAAACHPFDAGTQQR